MTLIMNLKVLVKWWLCWNRATWEKMVSDGEVIDSSLGHTEFEIVWDTFVYRILKLWRGVK